MACFPRFVLRFFDTYFRKVSLLALVMLMLAACKPGPNQPPTPLTPTPVPTPKPTPIIYVPSKRMEVAKLFNGIQIHATVEAGKGSTAKEERNTASSYMLDLQLKVKVPKPHSDLLELRKLNEYLPKLLPWLESALSKAKISPFYDDFYRLKVGALNRDLPRLDQLISRQHFFDCETALELQNPSTKRRALLVQASMEVDTDGSDSDRVPSVDGASQTYQPMTSYKWPKKTDKPNPFLASSQERLQRYEQELALKTSSNERNRDLKESLIPDARYEVNQLKKSSFLIAADDPYISIPGSLVSRDYEPYTPRVGDYCVVIFKNVLYPAIIGDVGPNYKIGEASLRICKELNSLANANNRPVSELKVTYLIFPNSADKPFDAPDLDKWHARCDQLLTEMGGYQGELKVWEDLTKPKPTPTPSPEESPAPSPTISGTTAPAISPAVSGTSVPSVPPSPSPSSSPFATAEAKPSSTPTPEPSASPNPSASAKKGGKR